MPLPSVRSAAVVAAAVIFTACSGPLQSTNALTPQMHKVSAEHIIQIGGSVYRFGGPAHVLPHRASWISGAAATQPLLYAASYNGDFINIYPAKGNNQAPIGQLTSGLTSPQGLAVDKYHRLWVADTNAFQVVAFKHGATAPFKSLSDPNYFPISVAVSSNGTVYAANAESTTGPPGNVTVWAHGSTSPTATLTSPDFQIVTEIGIDASNNIYVSYIPQSGPPAVMVFKAGSKTGQPLAIQDATLSDITFDTSKNLLMETASNTLGVWAPPYTSNPTRTINAFGNEPQFNQNEYKVCVAYANPNTPKVVCYNYKTGALVDTVTNGFSSNGYPFGIAFDPAAPL